MGRNVIEAILPHVGVHYIQLIGESTMLAIAIKFTNKSYIVGLTLVIYALVKESLAGAHFSITSVYSVVQATDCLFV